jgi:DNA-binding transcriptional MocR family regulator
VSAAGRYAQAVARRKFMSTITTIPTQMAIAAYLRQGAFDRHLKSLRRALARQQAAALAALERHLPRGYNVTRPAGGYFLWIELPEGVDAIAVPRAGQWRGHRARSHILGAPPVPELPAAQLRLSLDRGVRSRRSEDRRDI